jgi:Cu2+-exporting ATPase
MEAHLPRRRVLAGAAGSLALLAGCQAETPREGAVDRWPLARRDPGRTGFNPHADGPTLGREQWRVETDAPAATPVVDGETVYVGGPNLLRHLDVEVDEHLGAFADRAGSRGQGVVYLLLDDEAIGAVALADVIRDESFEAIETLHRMGVEVAMLTGDSEDVARAVSEELGIDTYFAEVLPEDKDEKIVELQEQGDLVAMVGDGVNDAPALTRSDVGIAIGSGTDVAVESADVVLVENDPRDVASLVKLSRKSYRKMQENIVWAAGYNVIALPLAAGLLAPVGILLSPAVGAVLMSASTVIVAVNAQLLRRADITS